MFPGITGSAWAAETFSLAPGRQEAPEPPCQLPSVPPARVLWAKCSLHRKQAKDSTRRRPRATVDHGERICCASRAAATDACAKRPKFLCLRGPPWLSAFSVLKSYLLADRSEPTTKPHTSWHFSNLRCLNWQHCIRATKSPQHSASKERFLPGISRPPVHLILGDAEK